MKKIFTALSTSLSFYLIGQVGINTSVPQATLDVVASPLNNTKIDGLIAPRLTGAELKSKDALYQATTPSFLGQTGAIVYVTTPLAVVDVTPKTTNVTSIGYYYFDGSVWQKFAFEKPSSEPWYNQATNTGATSNTQNIYQMGNVGIKTTNPVSVLNVKGINNQPATSGTTTNATIRVEGSTNHVLDIGTLFNSPWGTYLQSVDQTNLANSLPLILNPNSGNVGVNTVNPTEKLDIGAGNVRVRTISSNVGGTADRIVVADATGVLKTLPNNLTIGDMKPGLQTTDHNGWILLNGRLKSSLSASQQAAATSLGIGTNIPNATNSYLVQNGTALGSISNSNTRNINQNQLPNVALSGSTNNATPTIRYDIKNGSGANRAQIANGGSTIFLAADGTPGIGDLQDNNVNADVLFQDAHNHSVTTSSINGGVSQQALNIQPQSMSVNMFVYLGL